MQLIPVNVRSFPSSPFSDFQSLYIDLVDSLILSSLHSLDFQAPVKKYRNFIEILLYALLVWVKDIWHPNTLYTTTNFHA